MERPAQAPRQLPPGFRFHPTDEELVVQYLRRKVLARPLPAAVIPVVHDVARLDPWDLPGASEGEGYFFSLRRAPATGRGGRRRRAGSGYWKTTGKETPVFLHYGGRRQLLVGVKTALTFHRSEPSSSSSRTGWVMHEYRLAVPGDLAMAEQRKNANHGRVAEPGGVGRVPGLSEEQAKKQAKPGWRRENSWKPHLHRTRRGAAAAPGR